MTVDDAPSRIVCPIDLFDDAEREIKQLSTALNHARSAGEKGRLAHQLSERVSALLDCEAYDSRNGNCRLCREISTLRGKTATLIEKAAALG